MDSIGKVVAERYEIVEAAGDGGMACVWRALTRGAAGFSRPVAIKRIHSHLSDNTEFVRMFIEEARVGSQLDHANIVQTHDFGHDEGGYFLVMEWVDGLHLRQYVRSYAVRAEKTPWRMIAGIGAGVCAALEAAHGRMNVHGERSPVIHRDVTPANILVSVQGTPKLTDFGLARAMDRARMTNPDVVKGKLSYLAPELTHGEAAGPQSDIYALGIVLWESLAMERLYEGATDAERVLKVRDGAVPPITDHRDDLPHELINIVHKALAKDKSERYWNALSMEKDLLKLLGSKPVTSAEIGRSMLDARLALGMTLRSVYPPPPTAADSAKPDK